MEGRESGDGEQIGLFIQSMEKMLARRKVNDETQ